MKELLIRQIQEWRPQSRERSQGRWGWTTGDGETAAGSIQGRHRKKRWSHPEPAQGARKTTDTTESTEHRGWKSAMRIKWHKNSNRSKKIRKRKEKDSYGRQQRKQSILIKWNFWRRIWKIRIHFNFSYVKKLKLYVFKRNTITGKINSRQAMSRYILLKLLNLKIILWGVR